MSNPEINWGQDRGEHFYSLSSSASRMVAERITLESMRLTPPSLPLCTEKEAYFIEEFIPRAKQGFSLAIKSELLSKKEIEGFLKHTTPFTIDGIWHQLKLSHKENTLSEFGQFLTTLIYLNQKRKVTFYDFTEPPTEINYYQGLEETYWYQDTNSPESIWRTLEELETLTRISLYQSNNVSHTQLLTVGHFFMASKETASIFKR